MILADAIPTWQSTVTVLALMASAASVLFGGLMVLYMRRQTQLMAEANQRPPQPTPPQPFRVQIDEELHEQFADKEAFEGLVASNTARHAQLFTKIETVEKDARRSLGEEVSKINNDRARTMEKLNQEFTFIRESLTAINTELTLKRNKQS